MKHRTLATAAACTALIWALAPHPWSQARAQEQEQQPPPQQPAASSGPPRKYYRWVDADGITHYSRTPPPNDDGQTEASRITRAEQSAGQRSSGISAQYGKDGRIIGRVRDAAPARAELPTLKDPRRCEAVRTLIKQLETHPLLRETDPATGQTRILSEAARQSRYQAARQQEQAYCPN